jgi:subtilisin-like proprotein convertase family protein
MPRPSAIPALAVTVAVLTITGAWAAAPRETASRLDARIVHLEGKAIGVVPQSSEQLAPTDPLRAGWEEFKDRHPGRWKVYIDERSGLPTLVRGRGIEWFPAEAAIDLATLEARARVFLSNESELLGSWGSTIELDTNASRELRPGHRQLVFRQVIDGVRVENARLDFHVIRGRLVMFGATHWATPGINGVPAIGADKALDTLRRHLESDGTGLFPQGEPELTMIAVDAAPAGHDPKAWTGATREGLGHVLLWRFRLQEPGDVTLWIGEVDAHDGSVVAFRDGTHHVAVRGGVFPASNDGDCNNDGCEIARFPMPLGFFDEPGQTTATTDTYGHLQCIDGGASFDAQLSGPYVHIDDHCGAFVESGTCTDGLDLGMKAGENCAVDLLSSAGNTAAARTAFYHINRVAEAARFWDPTNLWLQTPLTVNVNTANSCNAFWSSGELVMRGEGNGCGNTGEQYGVLAHEWGHGYDANDGGSLMDNPGEGYADIIATFATRESCMSRGWYNDGRMCDGWGNACLSCTGVRDVDWAAHANNTPATPTSHLVALCPGAPGDAPCGRQNHCEGILVGETMYDLATRDLPAMGLDPDTAWMTAERIWYVSRVGSGGNMYFCILPNIYSCGATALHQRLLVADDDDGDLANGTPHAAAIWAAFDRHDMACGSSSDPENQNSSSCPALATPVPTLAETPGGTEVSWGAVSGAAGYHVYRSDLGCERRPIGVASLGAGETSWVDTEVAPDLPRFYRVEAVGANPVCTSALSTCESTPSGARLQMSDYRFIEPGPEINGFPDPGETVQVAVTQLNSGLDDAAGVGGMLSMADPAKGTVSEPLATWPVLPPAVPLESDAPHFELTVAETVPCGSVVSFDLEMSAANAATEQRRFSVQLGEKNRDFLNDTSVVIPPQTVAPATSTIVIDQDHTIAELDVSIDIGHDAAEELIVELTSPQNTTVRLHDRTPDEFGIDTRYDLETAPAGPGTMSDFVGESTLGTWTLSIEDVGAVGTGTLNAWTLHMSVNEGFDCVGGCDEPAPGEVPGLLMGRASGELHFQWGGVPLVAGYNVLQSPAATFDQAVEQIGQTDAATTSLTVEDTAGAVTFFQVRGFNGCGLEGP